MFLRRRNKDEKDTLVPAVPVSVSLESAATGTSHVELDMDVNAPPPPLQAPPALSLAEESIPVQRCSIVGGMSLPSLLASESSGELIEVSQSVLRTETLRVTPMANVRKP